MGELNSGSMPTYIITFPQKTEALKAAVFFQQEVGVARMQVRHWLGGRVFVWVCVGVCACMCVKTVPGNRQNRV